jgi:hypothetical protein
MPFIMMTVVVTVNDSHQEQQNIYECVTCSDEKELLTF